VAPAPAPAPAPRAGGSSTDLGSGSDNPRSTDGSAWFLGERKVQYCYEVAPDFAYRESIPGAVSQAFAQWSRYVDDKHLADSLPAQLRWSLAAEDVTQPGKACPRNTELILFLGVTPADVEPYLADHSDPLAFAQRLGFDLDTHRGRGFIWVAKQGPLEGWGMGTSLLRILTHELGHTLGIPHVRGTIMDSRISSLMREREVRFTPDTFVQIDGRRELAVGDLIRKTYSSYFYAWSPVEPDGSSYKRYHSEFRDPDGAMQAILGRKIDSSVLVHLDRLSPWRWDRLRFQHRQAKYEAVYSDWDVELPPLENLTAGLAEFKSEASLFRTAIDRASVFQLLELSYILPLRTRNPKGEPLEFSLVYNAAGIGPTRPDDNVWRLPITLYLKMGAEQIPIANFGTDPAWIENEEKNR
jgi:hypothetical protein